MNLAASRLFDRLILHHSEDENIQAEIPEEIDFSKNYTHLTPEQISLIEHHIKSEASFFMRGKFPSIIKTKTPVEINTGGATPKMAGYRRLNPAQNAVADEYVAKLIEADLAEPASGAWSSPI